MSLVIAVIVDVVVRARFAMSIVIAVYCECCC